MNIKKFKLYLEEEEIFPFSFQINNCDKVVDFCNNFLNLNKESQEVLYLIGADSQNNVSCVFEISRGNLNFSLCSPIEIFKRLIISNCNNFILVHNHLASVNPSEDDLRTFKELKKASKLFEIKFNDSLIIKGTEYYSFFENNVL